MILFYPLVLLAVLAGWVGPWVLLAAARPPRLIRTLRFYNQPKPEAAGLVPGARLAAVVRRLRVPPHPPGRRPAHPRPADERAAADHAALAVGLLDLTAPPGYAVGSVTAGQPPSVE